MSNILYTSVHTKSKKDEVLLSSFLLGATKHNLLKLSELQIEGNLSDIPTSAIATEINELIIY